MQPRALWPDDPIFVEVGAHNANLAIALKQSGYSKYLGVSANASSVAKLQAEHSELADQFTFSDRPRQVLHNNAEVLVLSGWNALFLWRFRYVRHAKSVAWQLSFNPLCWLALLGCLMHITRKRYSMPRVVKFAPAGGKTVRLLASRVRRQK